MNKLTKNVQALYPENYENKTKQTLKTEDLREKIEFNYIKIRNFYSSRCFKETLKSRRYLQLT